MNLHVIYHFQSSQNLNEGFIPANYQILYVFNNIELIERSKLVELAKAIPESNFNQLSFLNLEDLSSFCLRVFEEYGAKELFLISSQDYNIGLEAIKSKKDFWTMFESYGEKLSIPVKNGKKSLLGKIFT
jgi:hypothetical protein